MNLRTGNQGVSDGNFAVFPKSKRTNNPEVLTQKALDEARWLRACAACICDELTASSLDAERRIHLMNKVTKHENIFQCRTLSVAFVEP